MKTLLQIMRLPRGAERHSTAHHIWLSLALTALGCCVGVLALTFSATAYLKLHSANLFLSYFSHPLILALNLFPSVLLVWLGYFLTGRAWAGFLAGYLPTTGVALVNYFKIRLRSDPLLAADLRLAAEAGDIVGGYTLDLTWLVWFALGCGVAGTLFAIFLMPNGVRSGKVRLIASLLCLALGGAAFVGFYLNPQVYQRTDNSADINPWSDVEVFLSKGCTYPFLYSFREMFPTPPQGYDQARAAEVLARYEGADIPREKQVSILSIMLEAYCDFTDFPALADQPGVQAVYRPWHALEEQAVHGDLLTNIFAGGTVDSEWGFLTGYSQHGEFRRDTDSYVWYLRDQGYRTFGSHPGYGWFYNRQNVNRYLGFQDYWFTENHYGELVDPVAAVWDSDHVLMEELLSQLKSEVQTGPCFSFSVAYQNHGPYDTTPTSGTEYLTPDGSGLSQESCNILNHYLKGVASTLDATTQLVAGLEEMEEPVVLVLFGDHKPWAGNGNLVYTELGATFDLSTRSGFEEYYATPYLIWANSAAKGVLDNDFTGDGGDFSPCFLMPEVFDQCGWTGPAFMALSRDLRAITPLVHTQSLFLREEEITADLGEDEGFYREFLWAQYLRESGE